jgi:diguanylate cyclase
MKFFTRPVNDTLSPEQLELKASDGDLRTEIFKNCIYTLLHFLKFFVLDIKEIQPDNFRYDLDQLGEQFKRGEKTKRIEQRFAQEKEKILTFIERQNSYVRDREKELRDIIDLLTKAMSSLNVENLEFYQRVYDQSEKIIELTRLDDIKKIKISLKSEVDRMRETIDQKKNQERRNMQHLAGQVSSLRYELEQAKTKSLMDGLTGVYNRLALDDYLAAKVERSNIMGSDLALLMMDLDNFKKINDGFGHPIGDRVLLAFTQKCRGSIRGDDFLARYGGEEFVIIMPGANLRNGLKKAKQICKAVASACYATSEANTGSCLSITVSIGVSAFKKGDTPETLIARVDKALYGAKQKGKNRAIAIK